jgi:ABC-2 type transport system ATP-binding protein
MPAVLTIERLAVRYGARLAVDDVSFTVGRGELFGLLGPNGSGKSSTLFAVAGHIEPSAGDIRIGGLSRRDQPRAYALRLGFVPQEPAVYDELGPADNLNFFGGLYGLGGRELRQRVRRALEFVGLTANAERPLRHLSGGQRQRVNLACALLHDPAILLLDEPTIALDVTARADFFAHLNRLRSHGCAVVLTTHHLDEAERWCSRVGLLAAGRLHAIGAATDVLRPPDEAHQLEVELAAPPDAGTARTLTDRLQPSVVGILAGRSLHLKAADAEGLAAALQTLTALGLTPRRLRTPPPQLTPAVPVPREAACRAA